MAPRAPLRALRGQREVERSDLPSRGRGSPERQDRSRRRRAHRTGVMDASSAERRFLRPAARSPARTPGRGLAAAGRGPPRPRRAQPERSSEGPRAAATKPGQAPTPGPPAARRGLGNPSLLRNTTVKRSERPDRCTVILNGF